MDSHTGATPEPPAQPPALRQDWRFYTGLAALILSGVLPLLGLLIPLLGLPVGVTAVLLTLFVAGGPEVLLLAAVALLGKETLQFFLAKAKRAVREALLVQPVSKTRYYVGLAIAVVSLVPLYLYGYLPGSMPVGEARAYILVAADLSFVASVFVMGGEFWDKFRKLFVWEGKA
jgi:hypothetical protein